MEQSSINKNEIIREPNIFNKEYQLSTVEIIMNIIITLAYLSIITNYLGTKYLLKFSIIKFSIFIVIMWLSCLLVFTKFKNNEPMIVFIKFLISAVSIIVLYEITPPY